MKYSRMLFPPKKDSLLVNMLSALVVHADIGSVLPQTAIKGNENSPYNLPLAL
jgi:hypothetical protein